MKRLFQTRVLLSACMAAALALRVKSLGSFDLQFDEAFSLIRVGWQGVFGAIGGNPSVSRPRLLYNLCMYYWRQLFGYGEWALRFSSVLFGVLSALGLYLLSRELFDRKTGLISAMLLSVSVFHIHYSQALTVYPVTVCLAVFSFYFFIRTLKEQRFRNIVPVVVLNVTAVYLSHFYFFVILIQVLWLLMRLAAAERSVFRLWMAQVFQLAVFTPWFILLLHEVMRIKRERFVPVTPFNFSVTPVNVFYTLKNFAVGYYAGAVTGWGGFLLMTGLLAAGFFLIFRDDKKKCAMLLAAVAFPMLFLMLASRIALVYSDRYVAVSLIFYYAVIAFALGRMRPRTGALFLAVLGLFTMPALGNYYANRIFMPFTERPGISVRKQFKPAVRFLKSDFRDSDIVMHLSENSTLPFEYYFNWDSGAQSGRPPVELADIEEVYRLCHEIFSTYRGRPRFILHDLRTHRFEVMVFKKGAEYAEPADEKSVLAHPRVWLVYSFWDGGENPRLLSHMMTWLARQYTLVASEKYHHTELYLYEKSP